MSDINQPIFTRSYTEELREKLATGSNISDYLKPEMDNPGEGIMQSTLLVPATPPELDADVDADVENAIKLFEYLDGLDKTQASDKRLWVYLSHVTFRKYTMERWILKQSEDELSVSPDAKRKAISYIGERWFLSGNARSLRRHSIARLWWAAYLTVAPWLRDPEYFGVLENTDKYVYTKVLFSNQDIAQQILERRLGWSDKLLIAILEYLRLHPEVAQNRDAERTLMKELNLVLGYRKLTVLSFDELIDILEEAAQNSAISA